MTYSSRFFLYAPLVVFLLLCVAAGVHWWMAASALSHRLDAVNGREAMPGVTVSFAAKTIGGFPFSLDTEFTDFAVAVSTPDGPTRWRSEKFALHALTYGRDETVFEAAGKQRLTWGRGHSLDFAVGALRASAILHRGTLDRFDLDVIGFGSTAFTAQRLGLHVRQHQPAIQIVVTANGVTHCAVADLRYAATLSGAFDRLRAGHETWQSAVAAWRAAGGRAIAERPHPLASIKAEKVLDPGAVGDAICR